MGDDSDMDDLLGDDLLDDDLLGDDLLGDVETSLEGLLDDDEDDEDDTDSKVLGEDVDASFKRALDSLEVKGAEGMPRGGSPSPVPSEHGSAESADEQPADLRSPLAPPSSKERPSGAASHPTSSFNPSSHASSGNASVSSSDPSKVRSLTAATTGEAARRMSCEARALARRRSSGVDHAAIMAAATAATTADGSAAGTIAVPASSAAPAAASAVRRTSLTLTRKQSSNSGGSGDGGGLGLRRLSLGSMNGKSSLTSSFTKGKNSLTSSVTKASPAAQPAPEQPPQPEQKRRCSGVVAQESWLNSVMMCATGAEDTGAVAPEAVTAAATEHGGAGGAAEIHNLMEAVQLGDLPAAQALISLGQEPDKCVTEFGSTPLMEAAALGLVDMVKLLLEKGAEPGRRNKFGDTAYSKATEAGHQAVAALLPGGTHNFGNLNTKRVACKLCGKVVGTGRAGTFCTGCSLCKPCAMSVQCQSSKKGGVGSKLLARRPSFGRGNSRSSS